MFRYLLMSTKVLLVLKKYKRVDQRGSTPTPRRKRQWWKNKKTEYEQRKRKSNKAVAQQVQNLTKELTDRKQQLVDSEESKAQLETKLSKLEEVLSGVQHKLNEEIRLDISAGSKAAVKKAVAEERKRLQAQTMASVAETENLKEENQGEQGYQFRIKRKCSNNENRLRKQNKQSTTADEAP